MTTALSKSSVKRLLDKEIDGRPVTVSLDMMDNIPILHIRLKGYKTGWYANLNNLVEIASWHPRLKSADMELKMLPKAELKESLQNCDWKALYGKELIFNKAGEPD